MFNLRFVVVLAGIVLFPKLLLCQEPAQVAPNEETIHNDLRNLRDNLIQAFNGRDVDRLLSYCHRNVIATWANGEVTIGHEGVRDYYNRMMAGPDPVVAKLMIAPTVDDLSVIYHGTTAVSRGQMNDHFELTNGMMFDLNSRWSATVIKEGDRWLIASFHSSPNVFDNGVLMLVARRTMLWTGGIAGAVGLVVGTIATLLIVKRQGTRT